jgi:hypothetical protein
MTTGSSGQQPLYVDAGILFIANTNTLLVTASFSNTASYLLNYVPTVSSSWASSSISSSFASISNTASYAVSSSNARTASYVPTCSVAILSYAAQTADFALDSEYAYSASYAGTCSVFITNYLTSSQDSSSFASASISASYVPIGRSMVFCAAYTPVLTGPDAAEYVVPYLPDGATPATWSIKRFTLRAQLPESTLTVVNIEKSSGPGIFSATIVGSITLPAAAYEATSGSTPFTVVSGDKVRFNVATLGTAQNWTIITDISNT